MHHGVVVDTKKQLMYAHARVRFSAVFKILAFEKIDVVVRLSS